VRKLCWISQPWFLPCWAVLVSSPGWSCVGSEFSAVEASALGDHSASREVPSADASTAEISSSEAPAEDHPPREDAGASLEGGSGSDGATADMGVCSPDRFARDCYLWYTNELPDDSPCWHQCGPCHPPGAIYCLERRPGQ
jgi:hypothetical protein